MRERPIHELTAAYALDALEPDDARAYEEHLAGCESCRHALGDLVEAAGALAHAVPPSEPPAGLRRRVLAAARAGPSRPARLQPSWAAPAAAVAVVATCAAVGLGVWAATLQPSYGHLTALPLRGATGAVVVAGDRSAVLVVAGLARAPAGDVYEIWVVRVGATARPAGLFAALRTTSRVHLSSEVPAGSFVGVTLEPAGAAAPSGPFIVRSPTA